MALTQKVMSCHHALLKGSSEDLDQWWGRWNSSHAAGLYLWFKLRNLFVEATAAWAFAKALVRREFVYGQVVNAADPQLMEGGSTCPICQVRSSSHATLSLAKSGLLHVVLSLLHLVCLPAKLWSFKSHLILMMNKLSIPSWHITMSCQLCYSQLSRADQQSWMRYMKDWCLRL